MLALVCSLPNLLAGLALGVLRHTFTTRNPLLLMLNFFEGVFWGVPVVAAILIILIMAGCFAETRRYAAIVAMIFNIAALAVVLTVMRGPKDVAEWILFVPLVVALGGFGWIAGTSGSQAR